MDKEVYVIDGADFLTFEEFTEVTRRVLFPETCWDGNLDAFHDMLAGGFGTPNEGFILVWKNSELSRSRLGYSETARWLEARLKTCHPLNRQHVAEAVELAKQGIGLTLFDWLIEIIQEHDEIDFRLE